MLCRLLHVPQGYLADELGLTRVQLDRRLMGYSRWKASELVAVSQVLRTGLDGEGLPRLDSNQQPVDYVLAA